MFLKLIELANKSSKIFQDIMAAGNSHKDIEALKYDAKNIANPKLARKAFDLTTKILKKLQALLVAEEKCSEPFATALVEFLKNGIMFGKVIHPTSAATSLVKPLLKSDIAMTIEDIVFLLQDLNYINIRASLKILLPYKEEILAKILAHKAPTISQKELIKLIDLSDIHKIIASMPEKDASSLFLKNIFENPNLDQEMMNKIIFDPIFAGTTPVKLETIPEGDEGYNSGIVSPVSMTGAESPELVE